MTKEAYEKFLADTRAWMDEDHKRIMEILTNRIKVLEGVTTMTTKTERLRDYIRTMKIDDDTTTEQIVESCQQAVPGCTPEEIFTMLREVGEAQIREAEQLKAYVEKRQRDRGEA
jgi:hypothetical protein